MSSQYLGVAATWTGRAGTHQQRLDDLVLRQSLHDTRHTLEHLDELRVVDRALEPAQHLDKARHVRDEDLAVRVAQASQCASGAGHEFGLLQACDDERDGLEACVGVCGEPGGVGADEAEGGRAEGGERARCGGEAAEDRRAEERREVRAERGGRGGRVEFGEGRREGDDLAERVQDKERRLEVLVAV